MDHISCGGTCIRPIDKSACVVTCNGPCRRWFHPECAGFPNLSAQQLSYVLWFCNHCQREHPLPRSALPQVVQQLYRNEDSRLDHLPEEVFIMIFQYLNFHQLKQVRRTCKRWKGVVDGSTVLMQKFCLNFPRNIMMDRDYDPGCLLPAGCVQILEARIVTVEPWWSLLSSKLVKITLKDCVISLPELANMLRQSHCLKLINFESLYCPQIYDVATVANFQMPQMEVVELTDCVPSIDALLGIVCTRLKVFHSMPSQANGDDIVPDSNEKLIYLEKWQNTLEIILVTPSESMLSAIGSLKNLRLTELNLMCNFIRTDHIISFLQRMQHLKSLILTGILLSDSILRDIGRALPDLTYLIVEINREAVWNTSFLTTMPNLKQFSVISEQSPNPDAEATIIHFSGCPSRKLQKLELYCLEPCNWDRFHEFIKAAPELRSVALEAIGIDEWSTIFEALPMTKLRSLSLTSITNTPDVRNDSLVEYYENLRCLKLEHVTMGVQTLRALFRLCPQLEVVSLCHIASLDDFSVLVLCQKLKRLADLTIEACPITDASIGHIIENCKALERLDIQHCPELTPYAQDQIVASWLNEMMGRVMISRISPSAQR